LTNFSAFSNAGFLSCSPTSGLSFPVLPLFSSGSGGVGCSGSVDESPLFFGNSMGLTASNLSFSASCSLSLGRFFNASSAFVFASSIA
ncbi:hypothetical protein P9099_12165, partial [Gallibacterium anatis]